MRYFILEDNRSRCQKFMDCMNTPGNTVTLCAHVEQAKKILSEQEFDIIYLDHDLDGHVFVPSEEPNTGWQLARWIAENNIPYKEVITHTFNENGAKKILEVLPDAKWERFAL